MSDFLSSGRARESSSKLAAYHEEEPQLPSMGNGSDRRKIESEKYGRILDAAQGVFSRKGFHEATVEEIAELAGVGKGTVYLYFASKKELLVSLIEDRLDRIKELLRNELNTPSSALEKLKRLIAMHFHFYDRYRDFLSVMLAEVGDLRPELGERTAKARMELMQMVEDVIREGIRKSELREVKPRVAAYMLEGMANFVAFQWFIREHRSLLEEDLSLVVDLFLHGIARPED